MVFEEEEDLAISLFSGRNKDAFKRRRLGVAAVGKQSSVLNFLRKKMQGR